MIDIWKASVEYGVWGWNFPTAIITISFAYLILEVWALWKQNRLIWSLRSGESVSIIWFSYYGVHALAGIVYGVELNSITVTVTSLLLGLFHVPIIIGLWKFKKADGSLHRSAKLQVASFSLMLPAVLFLPNIHLVYTCLTIGIIYGLVSQPYEMWKIRSRGVLEPRLILIYLGSSLIWTCIGFYFFIPLFMFFSPVSALCLVAMLVLWFRYSRIELHKEVPLPRTGRPLASNPCVSTNKVLQLELQ